MHGCVKKRKLIIRKSNRYLRLLSCVVLHIVIFIMDGVFDSVSVENESIVEHLRLLRDVVMLNSSEFSNEGSNNGTFSIGAATLSPATNFDNLPTLAFLLETGRIQIPLYSVIFLLAVIGNSLVILTLVQNKRMRTITNLFLLNLAVSDLFLGVFCMPFTLVGTLLRDFIFGEVMCKLLPYLQASSVAVSAWTLVIISVERYYAICHPLRSRRRQTLSHAYRLIALIWCGSLFFMLPIAILSKLIPTNQGHNKCRELWSDRGYERAYNLFLDMILLVLPLLILAVAYSLMTRTLCRGMHDFKHLAKSGSVYGTAANDEIDRVIERGETRTTIDRECSSERNNNNRADQYTMVYIRPYGSNNNNYPSPKYHQTTSNSGIPTTVDAVNGNGSSTNNPSWSKRRSQWSQETSHYHNNYYSTSPSSEPSAENRRESIRMKNSSLRKSNAEKSLVNKKRIIKMLFVVVLEFFLCWTPLYVINTMALFWPTTIYHNLGYTAISFFQLLAYSSSCCNPITYCFMSSGFRKAFLNLFHCCQSRTGIGKNRRNSALSGMYLDSGVFRGSMRTLASPVGKYIGSSNRLQCKNTIDTVLNCDGVVSLKQLNDSTRHHILHHPKHLN